MAVSAPWPSAVSQRMFCPNGGHSLGLAHYWQHLLDTGRFGSLKEIAAAEGMDLGQVSWIARLAWG